MTTLQSFNIPQSVTEPNGSASNNPLINTAAINPPIDLKAADAALKRYSEIRIALYKQHVYVKDIAIQLNVTSPTISRTIQGIQHNLKVIDWIKQNLGIDLPIPPEKFKIGKKPPKPKPKSQKVVLNPKYKKYFTARELTFYYGMSYKSLAQQRFLKIGIPYVKLSRKVLYAKEDIERYIAANSVKIKTI